MPLRRSARAAIATAIALTSMIAACARTAAPSAARGAVAENLTAAARDADPRVNPRARPIVIQDATIMTAAGTIIERGSLLLEAGAIAYVGATPPPAPADAIVIDGRGKIVTPGLI